MNKKTTPQRITSEKTSTENPSPAHLTLAIIRQFARAYVFESRLPQKINGYVVN